jgi:NO-binding membrane sensor protein with MHYT domain
MIEFTIEPWALALAAGMAMLLASTSFSLVLQSSVTRSRGAACVVLLSSWVLAFGLWTTNLVQVLSLRLPGQPGLGFSWLVLTFVIAASSQACALLFVAFREPDKSSIVGSAFALAIGVEAIHCAAPEQLPAELVLHEGTVWICGSFLMAFLAFLAGMWIWLKLRGDRSGKARCLRGD